MVKREANNIELFLESQGYIQRDPEAYISSKELARIYNVWCEENAYPPVKSKTLVEYLTANQEKHGVVYSNNVINEAGRRVRGIQGPQCHRPCGGQLAASRSGGQSFQKRIQEFLPQMMRTCVRAERIQFIAAHFVRTHVRIKTVKKRFMLKMNLLKNRRRL